MTVVIPDEGKEIFLNRILALGDNYPFTDFIVRLFKNDYVPVDGSRIMNFVQATFPGYAAVTISHTDWPDNTPVGHVASSTSVVSPVYTCTGGGGELIYGFYVESGSGGFCLAAARFDVPLNMTNTAVITLNPFTAQFPLCP